MLLKTTVDKNKAGLLVLSWFKEPGQTDVQLVF